MASHELKAAIRSMLVPVTPQAEDEYINFVEQYLAALDVAEADRASWIAVELRRWRNEEEPSEYYRTLVNSALFRGGREPESFMFENPDGPVRQAYVAAARYASQRYFDIHKDLTSQHLLDHDAARQLMSHLGMIVRLSVEERMTASEISRLIAIRDRRFELNWRMLSTIMSRLHCAPSLSLEAVAATFEDDAASEASLFGDLDIQGSIERIGHIARELGCPGDFRQWLQDLIINDLHPPYLVLLHYQLLIQAHFDHAVTYAYEFSPRGQSVTWLTEQYISAGIPVARNAYLNNAKATLRFDRTWAIGRVDHLKAAHSLANVLEQFESLGVLAKDELAAQIRGLLHRYIRIREEENAGGIPEELNALTDAQLAELLRAISGANTRTSGIVEQRIVDSLGFALHPAANGWSNRGLGDAVFAANVFRKKFGDCEFELHERPRPRIVAYEAHGGRLTRPYVEDHINSFRDVLAARREELESAMPLEHWGFEVVFVAHEFSPEIPEECRFLCNGAVIDVRIEQMSFEQVCHRLRAFDDCNAIVNRLFTERLNSRFVHPDIRATVKALAGI